MEQPRALKPCAPNQKFLYFYEKTNLLSSFENTNDWVHQIFYTIYKN